MEVDIPRLWQFRTARTHHSFRIPASVLPISQANDIPDCTIWMRRRSVGPQLTELRSQNYVLGHTPLASTTCLLIAPTGHVMSYIVLQLLYHLWRLLIPEFPYLSRFSQGRRHGMSICRSVRDEDV